MTIPGYDPRDLDALVEQQVSEGDIEAVLTEEERAAYRAGDATVTELLDEETIGRLLD
jgi:hypothetical protein